MNPLLILGAVGAGVALLLANKKSSASTPPSVSPVYPTTTPTPTPAPPGMISTPTSAPKTYTVQRGDYPGLIAQKITGDAGRWLELTRANPSKPVWTSAEIAALKAAKKTVPGSAQAGNFKTLYAGEVLTLPANW